MLQQPKLKQLKNYSYAKTNKIHSISADGFGSNLHPNINICAFSDIHLVYSYVFFNKFACCGVGVVVF